MKLNVDGQLFGFLVIATFLKSLDGDVITDEEPGKVTGGTINPALGIIPKAGSLI